MNLQWDAWSSGQVESKLWLCRELEKISFVEPQSIWILGGWYGVLASLLLSRERIPIGKVRSFEIDELATEYANKFNENWVWQDWKFRAFTQDANVLDYTAETFGPKPSIVINTAVEHFASRDWFEKIPSGMLVALQSNDMQHEDHVANVNSLAGFIDLFPIHETIFSGELEFIYPAWTFKRFLLIGRK